MLCHQLLTEIYILLPIWKRQPRRTTPAAKLVVSSRIRRMLLVFSNPIERTLEP